VNIKFKSSFYILTIGFLLIISACTSNEVGCGTESVKYALTKAIIEHYGKNLQNGLEINNLFIEEKKEKRENAIITCTAIAEVEFKKDTLSAWNEFLVKSKQYLDDGVVVISSRDIVLKDQVNVVYDIKKNQADGGYFINGDYSSINGYALSEHVIKYTDNFDKTLETYKGIHSLIKFDSLLDKYPKNGEELKSIIQNMDLKIDFCTENQDKGKYELTCRISNLSGYSIIEFAKEAGQIDQEMKALIQFFATLSGKNISESRDVRTISDPANIDKILKANIIFTTKYSEPNLSESCRVIICE
jgi:hypothetical protein